MSTHPLPRSAFLAALMQRCPRCREGRLFDGPLSMPTRCPKCDLVFQREEGYYLGAMYFSYFLAVLVLTGIFLIGMVLLPGWRGEFISILSGVVFLPFVPVVFRASRVLWIYFDRWAWPGR